MGFIDTFLRYGLTRETLLIVLAEILAVVFALVLHELAHGLIALLNGDNTAKLYGRLSVNPLRHFDIVGLAMMLLVGFGWAKPVPINPNNFKNRKVGAITVSVAGIVTNLRLAFLCAIGVAGLETIAVINPDSSLEYFVYFCFWFMLAMVQINISFALFNLLPLFPLDGYRLISCFVNENNGFMRFMRRYSLYILLGFIVLNYIPVVSSYSPLRLYLSGLGGLIQDGFISLWRLVF